MAEGLTGRGLTGSLAGWWVQGPREGGARLIRLDNILCCIRVCRAGAGGGGGGGGGLSSLCSGGGGGGGGGGPVMR